MGEKEKNRGISSQMRVSDAEAVRKYVRRDA